MFWKIGFWIESLQSRSKGYTDNEKTTFIGSNVWKNERDNIVVSGCKKVKKQI